MLRTGTTLLMISTAQSSQVRLIPITQFPSTNQTILKSLGSNNLKKMKDKNECPIEFHVKVKFMISEPLCFPL